MIISLAMCRFNINTKKKGADTCLNRIFFIGDQIDAGLYNSISPFSKNLILQFVNICKEEKIINYIFPLQAVKLNSRLQNLQNTNK